MPRRTTRNVRKSFNKVSRRRYNKRSVKQSNRRYKRTIKKRINKKSIKRINKKSIKRFNKRSIKRRSKKLQVGGTNGILIRWAKDETDAQKPFYAGQLEKTFAKEHRQFFNAYVINYIKDKILCVPQLDTRQDAAKYTALRGILKHRLNSHYPFKGFFDELGKIVPEYQYQPDRVAAINFDAPLVAPGGPQAFKFGLIRHSESESNWLVSKTLEKWYGYVTAFLTPYGRALAFSTGYNKLYEEVYIRGDQLKLYSSTLPRSMVTAMLLLRGLIKRIKDELNNVPEGERAGHALTSYLSSLNRNIKVVHGISEIPVAGGRAMDWSFVLTAYAQRIMGATMLEPMLAFLNNTEGGDGISLQLNETRPFLWEADDDTGTDWESYKSSAHSINRFFDKLHGLGDADTPDTRHIFVVHGILMEKYVSWPFFIKYITDALNIGSTTAGAGVDHAAELMTAASASSASSSDAAEGAFGVDAHDPSHAQSVASMGDARAADINASVNNLLNYFTDVVNPGNDVFVGPFKCLKQRPRWKTWENRYVVIDGNSLNVYADEGGSFLKDPRGSSIDLIGASVEFTEDTPGLMYKTWWAYLTITPSDDPQGKRTVKLCFGGQTDKRDPDVYRRVLYIKSAIERVSGGIVYSWKTRGLGAARGAVGALAADAVDEAKEIEDRWSKLLFFGSKRRCDTIKGLIDNIHAFHRGDPELSIYKQQHYDRLLEIEYGIKVFIDYTMDVAMNLDTRGGASVGLPNIMEVINDPRSKSSNWLRTHVFTDKRLQEQRAASLAAAADLMQTQSGDEQRQTLAIAQQAHQAQQAQPDIPSQETMGTEDRAKLDKEFTKLMYAPLGKTPNNCSMVMGTLTGPKPEGVLAGSGDQIVNISGSTSVQYKLGPDHEDQWLGAKGKTTLTIQGSKLVLTTNVVESVTVGEAARGAGALETQHRSNTITLDLNKLKDVREPKNTYEGHYHSLRLNFFVPPIDCLETNTLPIPGLTTDKARREDLKIIIDLKTATLVKTLGYFLTKRLETKTTGDDYESETKDNLRNIYLLHCLKDVKFVSPSLRFKTTDGTDQGYLRPTSTVPEYTELLREIAKNTPSHTHHSDSVLKQKFTEVVARRNAEYDAASD
jgi:hypothetical protein